MGVQRPQLPRILQGKDNMDSADAFNICGYVK